VDRKFTAVLAYDVKADWREGRSNLAVSWAFEIMDKAAPHLELYPENARTYGRTGGSVAKDMDLDNGESI
jgi:hypothetical protein